MQRWAVVAAALLALATGAGAAEIAPADRKSGYEFLSRETRAMQDDDAANPGMLWVLEGATLWARKTGAAGRPQTLEQRVNTCRVDRQQAPALGWESRELLALTAWIARQSRGLPVEIAGDERTRPFVEAGRATFERRQGQMNLSCRQCHDDYWGRRLAGTAIPQAHPTGYPLYRLEWQGLGSLQRRLRNCLFGMRAEPYAFGAPEMVDLELFLMWRARGMLMESPAVRP